MSREPGKMPVDVRRKLHRIHKEDCKGKATCRVASCLREILCSYESCDWKREIDHSPLKPAADYQKDVIYREWDEHAKIKHNWDPSSKLGGKESMGPPLPAVPSLPSPRNSGRKRQKRTMEAGSEGSKEEEPIHAHEKMQMSEMPLTDSFSMSTYAAATGRVKEALNIVSGDWDALISTNIQLENAVTAMKVKLSEMAEQLRTKPTRSREMESATQEAAGWPNGRLAEDERLRGVTGMLAEIVQEDETLRQKAEMLDEAVVENEKLWAQVGRLAELDAENKILKAESSEVKVENERLKDVIVELRAQKESMMNDLLKKQASMAQLRRELAEMRGQVAVGDQARSSAFEALWNREAHNGQNNMEGEDGKRALDLSLGMHSV